MFPHHLKPILSILPLLVSYQLLLIDLIIFYFLLLFDLIHLFHHLLYLVFHLLLPIFLLNLLLLNISYILIPNNNSFYHILSILFDKLIYLLILLVQYSLPEIINQPHLLISLLLLLLVIFYHLLILHINPSLFPLQIQLLLPISDPLLILPISFLFNPHQMSFHLSNPIFIFINHPIASFYDLSFPLFLVVFFLLINFPPFQLFLHELIIPFISDLGVFVDIILDIDTPPQILITPTPFETFLDLNTHPHPFQVTLTYHPFLFHHII